MFQTIKSQLDALGTVFSPNRWSAYFSCVDENGG
jgi:hypothetical protein